MDNFEFIGGLIGSIISLLVILFRRTFAHSHILTVGKGFGGKSFVEQFGEEKGVRAMAIFGSIMLLFSLAVLLAGMFGVELPRKQY